MTNIRRRAANLREGERRIADNQHRKTFKDRSKAKAQPRKGYKRRPRS
jgi:hypothetical protein